MPKRGKDPIIKGTLCIGDLVRWRDDRGRTLNGTVIGAVKARCSPKGVISRLPQVFGSKSASTRSISKMDRYLIARRAHGAKRTSLHCVTVAALTRVKEQGARLSIGDRVHWVINTKICKGTIAAVVAPFAAPRTALPKKVLAGYRHSRLLSQQLRHCISYLIALEGNSKGSPVLCWPTATLKLVQGAPRRAAPTKSGKSADITPVTAASTPMTHPTGYAARFDKNNRRRSKICDVYNDGERWVRLCSPDSAIGNDDLQHTEAIPDGSVHDEHHCGRCRRIRLSRSYRQLELYAEAMAITIDEARQRAARQDALLKGGYDTQKTCYGKA